MDLYFSCTIWIFISHALYGSLFRMYYMDLYFSCTIWIFISHALYGSLFRMYYMDLYFLCTLRSEQSANIAYTSSMTKPFSITLLTSILWYQYSSIISSLIFLFVLYNLIFFIKYVFLTFFTRYTDEVLLGIRSLTDLKSLLSEYRHIVWRHQLFYYAVTNSSTMPSPTLLLWRH